MSARFLIRRDGQIVQFVSTDRRAMHAGNSSWNGRGNINSRSLGIELEGSNLEPYEDAQYASLAVLTQTLQAAYPLTEVLGHADVAPGRKADPGPYFDWRRYSPQTGTIQRASSGSSRAFAGQEGTRPALPYRRHCETREMLDFCGQQKIVSDFELIPIQDINTAYERMLKGDVKYRFVIDMGSLQVEAPPPDVGEARRVSGSQPGGTAMQ